MSCAVEAMRNIQLPLKRLHLHDFVSMVYYWGLTVLFFVVLLYTRSRSGLLGFAVADVLFWLLLLTQARTSSSQPGEPVRLSVKAGFAIHIVLAAVLLINGTGTPALDRYLTVNGLKNLVTKSSSPRQNNTPQTAANPSYVAPALESGGTESGVIRKYVWQGAITAWKSSTKALLIGTGTESFAFAFYRYRPVAHNLTSEWDFLYNKAHNEYLNYLATTGIFGLGSYLVFLLVAMWWMLFGRNKRKTPIAPQHSLMQMALFAGWVSILVTNFFGFSVVIVQVFLFLLPCMVMAMAIAADEDAIHTVQISVPKWVTWATMVIGIYLLFTIGKFWYADTLYAQGYRLNRASAVAQATPLLITAVSLNPSEPMYHDELSNSYASLAVGEAQSQNATQAASLAKLAVDENDKTLAISPNNVNYWKSRTKIFYTLSALDPALNQQAIDALNSALALSPNDPKIYYNLAVLVGRQGNGDAAVSDLMKAKELKPNYRDAYYALSIFYGEQNKKTEARAILQSYLDTIDPTDKQFHDILAK
jgi:tetratricopeptide (TPR) repeat protein